MKPKIIKAFVIDCNEASEDFKYNEATDAQWKEEAEKQYEAGLSLIGGVHSLLNFQIMFNDSELTDSYVRFLEE